ncbi:hypothetical protein COLO4_16348 [Corchorus olitorius]|uniref:Uncharacterized protein n=1 Tax=Corchorus olitorius TaxID=93759 RepID=A0A1R3JHX3_9ROSI|nr:hypothetical protein COLO4_16348 [Corchorus olitorius]
MQAMNPNVDLTRAYIGNHLQREVSEVDDPDPDEPVDTTQ